MKMIQITDKIIIIIYATTTSIVCPSTVHGILFILSCIPIFVFVSHLTTHINYNDIRCYTYLHIIVMCHIHKHLKQSFCYQWSKKTYRKCFTVLKLFLTGWKLFQIQNVLWNICKNFIFLYSYNKEVRKIKFI